MPEDWQIGFKVKGLGAPEREIVFDDYILVRGVPGSDSSYIFFRFTPQNDEEKDRIRDDFINVLTNIAQMYGLVTNVYVEALLSSVTAKISSEHHFGHTKYPPELGFVAVIEEEDRRNNLPLIEKTLAKYESCKAIFQDKKKGFLKNAIDYYYRSLKGARLEERLIDLMISLESLFSDQTQELRLKLSLRASFLLSAEQESELPHIFRNIYNLYDKRSKVVHGIKVVKLDEFEISALQKYVREAIKRFIHIEMPKEDILNLIDESVYDKEKRNELNRMVLEAINQW